jgi:hypothetical protein
MRFGNSLLALIRDVFQPTWLRTVLPLANAVLAVLLAILRGFPERRLPLRILERLCLWLVMLMTISPVQRCKGNDIIHIGMMAFQTGETRYTLATLGE